MINTNFYNKLLLRDLELQEICNQVHIYYSSDIYKHGFQVWTDFQNLVTLNYTF